MRSEAPMPSPISRSLVALLTVIASGCSSDRVSSVGPSEVHATPGALSFIDIAVGGRARSAVSLINAGQSAGTVSFIAPSPFEAPEAVQLGAGEQREVVVSFVPPHAGAFEGELLIDTGAGPLRVALQGNAVDCAPTDACELAFADPEDGTCVHAPAIDGSACTNTCINEGSCFQGACTGYSQSCDDGDACTIDGCAGAGGCTHSVVRCDEDDDPCTAAACDPTRGCMQVPVVDGTACGASTCSAAHVCMSGSCVEVPAQEGSVCGVGSPCQAPGTCHLGACERPEAHELSADWSFTPQPGNSFGSALAMDADENLYFVETAHVEDRATLFGQGRVPVGWLVSVTPSGQLRYREPLYAPEILRGMDVGASDWTPGRMLVDAGVVVLLGTSSIEARTASTGAPLWRHELRRALVPGHERTNLPQSLASDGAHVFAQYWPAPGENYDWLFAFDLRTGAPLWEEGEADADGLSVDAHGNVIHRYRPATTDRTAIRTWDRSHTVLIDPGCEPLAGYADRIYASTFPGLAVLKTSAASDPNGESACTAPFGETISSCFWIMRSMIRVGAGPIAYVLDPLDHSCGPDSYPDSVGFQISGVGDSVQWQLERPAAEIVGDDILTDRHGLLFSEVQYGPKGREGYQIVELDPWGQEVFSCPSGIGAVSMLGNGRAYSLYPLRLSSAAVPGVRIAPHGWTAENGGPGRTRRIQPAASWTGP